jgi:D-amino-acid dehydrogenase
MQIAVIGGGVAGVCTAYYLAQAGHEVVVVERYGNVAQEASFGNAGMMSPGLIGPWAAPGMPRKILASLLKQEAPVLLKAGFDPPLWRWLRIWLNECQLERYRVNKTRMQRLASYSHALLLELREQHTLDYEQTKGVLQLFRTQRDIDLAQPALALLVEANLPHKLLDAEAARGIEPALNAATPLAGALHHPQDEAGNCPLFTRHLKNIAQSIGVEFHFNSTVQSIHPENNGVTGGVTFRIDDRTFKADAVVLAAGMESARLLEPHGVHMPLYPVKGYSATALIKNFDEAPLAALMDESYKVAITRMGSRIRIAGTAELGSRTLQPREAAIRTLVKVGEDWFPDAANYHTATFWNGTRPMLPDGPPLIGATPVPHVFINIGHCATGWSMAPGSGKVLADLISGRTPDIDLDGLTLTRYKHA